MPFHHKIKEKLKGAYEEYKMKGERKTELKELEKQAYHEERQRQAPLIGKQRAEVEAKREIAALNPPARPSGGSRGAVGKYKGFKGVNQGGFAAWSSGFNPSGKSSRQVSKPKSMQKSKGQTITVNGTKITIHGKGSSRKAGPKKTPYRPTGYNTPSLLGFSLGSMGGGYGSGKKKKPQQYQPPNMW